MIKDRYKAKSVAKEEHLYSLERSRGVPNVQIERQFLGPHVDDPAATVHAKLLVQGVRHLTSEEKMAWSSFLISLMLRTPPTVAHLRQSGRTILSAVLDAEPTEYLAVRGQASEATLLEWVVKHQPDLLDDLGVMTLPRLARSTELNLALLNATWVVRAVGQARCELVIGDHPLFLAGKLGTNFLLALPLSPRRMFFAFNDNQVFENIKTLDDTAFVEAANVSAVSSAERYVYARNDLMEPLIEKLLRKA